MGLLLLHATDVFGFARAVDSDCIEIEQKTNLTHDTMVRQRTEIGQRALIELANFKPLGIAEKAIAKEINSLEKRRESRMPHEAQMSQGLRKALDELRAGIAATERLVPLAVRILLTDFLLRSNLRDGERWLILDNPTLVLVDSTAAHFYEPLYEFDVNGVWEFRSISHGVGEFRPSIKKREVLSLSQHPFFSALLMHRPYRSPVGEPKRSRCQM